MDRHKTINIKRNARISKPSRNNNVLLLKFADPIVQCCIFIYFIMSLDAAVLQPSYRTLFLMLIMWQYGSALVNLFYKDNKPMRIQRIVYLLAITCYMPLFFYIEKHVKEYDLVIDELENTAIHLHQTITMGVALILAFWYSIICYREVKVLLTSFRQDQE